MDVVIIEDEPRAAQLLEHLIKESDPSMEVIAKLGSVRQSLAWLKENQHPKLIFMDIQLGDGNSFQLFDQVEISCPIIFTTAYNEFALRAFKVNSIDYLLKPIVKEDLKISIEKFKRVHRVEPPTGQGNQSTFLENISMAMAMITKKYKGRFVIKVGEHLRAIESSEILFFYSLEKVTFAQTRDGRKHIIDFTMEQLEEVIDPARFFRINRKYIVATDSIQDMISFFNSRLRLVLKTSDDKEIIVAREKIKEFKDWLDR